MPDRRQPASRRRRLIRWAWRGCGLGMAALLLIGAYFWLSTPLPSPERLRARAALGSTRILDRRGQLLFEAPDPLSGWRRPLPIDEIPLALRQATIAIEDRDFYANHGVDPRGILRAAWANLRSGELVAGGSTITQQLARGFLLDPELAQQRTLDRKLREAVLALKLTAVYPKDEILALYLNQTYYGGMAYGVEAAAQRFFGKPARDLDLAECALLAGLPQAPSHYDPLADPAAAQARQAQVLDAMLRAGSISAAQAEAAKAEPLQFAASPELTRAPHFVTYVLDQLAAQLGPEAVARGGLTITTTLDADLNDAAQQILRRQLAQLAQPRDGGPDHQAHNGAVVVLDPASGAILAMVGSPDFGDAAIQGQVNAALARRQPGSAIKPLTYAAALEQGWTPATTILDVPTSFATREGRPYVPQNYDRAYHGPLSLREALATSSNISAVRVLDHIGVPALLDIADRLGIESLSQDSGRYGLALTLGGGEVTPLELTAAYAAFANGGQRVTPFAIVSISRPPTVDERQETGDRRTTTSSCHLVILSSCHLVDGQSSVVGRRSSVVDPGIAYLISDILSDRYARMRAFGVSSVLDVDRPAAVKTGTTSDWRDNWTVGYTPDRAVGVWVGNADGRSMEGISGVTGAGPVWHEVMLAAHRGLPPRPFARPAGIVELAICAEGGLLPGPHCPGTRPERFVAGTQPTRADDSHVLVEIDPALGCRAPQDYPLAQTAQRVFRVLPPEAEAWSVSAGLPLPPRQLCPNPTKDESQRTNDTSLPSSSVLNPSSELAPALLSPAHGAVFTISPGVPRERQRIGLRAQAGDGARKLTIYVDGQPLASFSAPPYRAFWQIEPGAHRVVVQVEDAQGVTRKSEEVHFTVEP